MELSEDLSLLGFLSGGWSLLRMLLVLEEDKQINVYVTHTLLKQGSEHEAPARIYKA